MSNGFLTPQNYGEITYEDIIDPSLYLNSNKMIRLSPQDEFLSKTIDETIQKQKSLDEFLEELDKKYKNKENSEQNNTDILASFGTYLSSDLNSTNYSNQPRAKRSLNVRKNKEINIFNDDSFNSFKYNKWNNYFNEGNTLDQMELSKSMAKINEIYDEYERYTSLHNFSDLNLRNLQSSKYEEFADFQNNKSKNKSLLISTNDKSAEARQNRNEMIGRDESLYQSNLRSFNKLSNYNLSYDNADNNENEDNNDNNEIKIMDYNNESKTNNTMINLVIEYKLPDKEDEDNKNISRLHLDNVNQLIKIQTLRNEIKSRIYNELKLKGLDKNYSIEKISLFIPSGFLENNKKLIDYKLADNYYNIQAFITYNSIGNINKKLSQSINKKNNVKKSVKESKMNKSKEVDIDEDKLVPIDLVPKLTKEGYKCSPSIMELSRKTEKELRRVENFKIFNKYGEVEFKEPVNLFGLNLDNQVTIERNLIDTGDKLNYWSIFKLHNFRVGQNGLNNYKVNLEKSGGNFLSYKNNELVWEYKGNN
jgi:hypothetical protein